MKVTVISPSIRPKGLDIVLQSLKNQTFKDWEWLIGSSFDPKIKEARWVKDDFKDGYWTLNRIYNKLFKEAKGDILVSWQDFIWAPPDALQKFVNKVTETGGLVSGVGDQYDSLNKYGKPEIPIWWDPRKRTDFGAFYKVYPGDVEWNFAAFPKKAVFDVGGMDEGLDFLGVSGDQLQIVNRMDDFGYKGYLDQTNESFTLRHGREDFGGEDEWNSKNVVMVKNKEGVSIYDQRVKELKESANWPVLNYLKSPSKPLEGH
jgi:hypothetical protein